MKMGSIPKGLTRANRVMAKFLKNDHSMAFITQLIWETGSIFQLVFIVFCRVGIGANFNERRDTN
jgi:hypothetical protein